MTVAIVATAHDGHVVSVTDRMISNEDIFQGDDSGILKTMQVAPTWFVAFADDPSAFRRVWRKMTEDLKGPGDIDDARMRSVAVACYQQALHEEFAGKHLVQLGYQTVQEFRVNGRQELGDKIFNDLIQKLQQFDLRLELAVLGIDVQRPYAPRMFEVVNPGRVIEHVTGYAVLGSGHHMAMAALRRKPLEPRDLPNVIYRLLDAKFAAESASGVGTTTTAIWIRPDGQARRIDTEEIDRVRAIWAVETARPNPPDAISLIETLAAD